MKQEKIINPREWYSMSDIVKHQLFPWCKGLRVVRRIIKNDSVRGNNRSVLKTQITGEGRGTKYIIKGENLIRFIKKVEGRKIKP